MRWVTRVCIAAIARRSLLGWLAMVSLWGMAWGAEAAQAFPDQGSAYAACITQTTAYVKSNPSVSNPRCVIPASKPNWYEGRYTASLGTGVYGTFSFPANSSCGTRADYNGVFPGSHGAPRSGSVQCDRGCMAMWTPNVDGTWNSTTALNAVCSPVDEGDQQCINMGLTTGFHYSNYTNTCEPDEQECTASQKKNARGECVERDCPVGMTLSQLGTCDNEKNECPAGEVKAPSGECLPGDGQCAQGEARGDDGTCKKDADGDGEPDEDDPDNKSFSGGDSCDAPPSCSGDPIMCGQARIQWRIDCNTRRNVNISGGACSDPPICTGKDCKAMEYAQLLMQWRTACALERGIGGSSGEPDPNVAAIKDALTGNAGDPDIGAEGDPADSWAGGGGGSGGDGDPIDPDTTGYGWGSTCPQPPSVEVLGQSIQFDTAPVCQWLGLGSYFVLALAALASVRIVGSKEA